MKILFVLSLLILTTSSAKLPMLCGCIPYDRPVCASNYETYRNECEMGCDPLNPRLFTLYNGPCIMAKTSADARDQYATRHSSQYHPKDYLQAESWARLTEGDVNSHFGAVANAMRLHHGDHRVVSLNDHPKIHIQIDVVSRKAKDLNNAAINDERNQIQQREVSRNGGKNQVEDLTVETQHQQNHDLFTEPNHGPLYPLGVIVPNSQSDSETSSYGDQEQNGQQ